MSLIVRTFIIKEYYEIVATENYRNTLINLAMTLGQPDFSVEKKRVVFFFPLLKMINRLLLQH